MPSLVSYKFVKGSKNWQAFLSGNMDARTFVASEYGAPIAEEVNAELVNIERAVVQLFDNTTEGWEHKPEFRANASGKVDENLNSKISLSIEVTGAGAENWERVNEGTVKHRVPTVGFPSKLMPMRTYVRSTQPGTGLPRSAGRGRYNAMQPGHMKMKQVVYQSIRARHFTGRIVEYLKGNHDQAFSNRIAAALKKAVRRINKSG